MSTALALPRGGGSLPRWETEDTGPGGGQDGDGSAHCSPLQGLGAKRWSGQLASAKK